MSAAGVAAVVAAARRHIYKQFEQYNAFSEQNAVTLEELSFNYRRYSYTKKLLERYRVAGVIIQKNHKYWFNKDKLQQLHVKQMHYVLIGCGITLAALAVFVIMAELF